MTTSERAAARAAFIERAGWGSAEVRPLSGDASTRSYARLVDGEREAILMDAPAGAEAPACPELKCRLTKIALGILFAISTRRANVRNRSLDRVKRTLNPLRSR